MKSISNSYRYRSYNGNDKYHFRVSKKIRHPVIITNVDLNKRIMGGYGITDSENKKFDRNYFPLEKNPNPKNSKIVYVNKRKSYGNFNTFSKPYPNWHLSYKDEIKIDELEKRKK
ncbi:MAG: hypothetical protein J1F32_01850 [Erysipelotrichales bacterium]|nr:hypothetical protein [Erysipelotrichales bacterium]